METSELIKQLGLEGKTPEEIANALAQAYMQQQQSYTPYTQLEEQLKGQGGLQGLIQAYRTMQGGYQTQQAEIERLKQENERFSEAARLAQAQQAQHGQNAGQNGNNYWDGYEYMEPQQQAVHIARAVAAVMQQQIQEREPEVVGGIKSEIQKELEALRNDWQSHRNESDIFQKLIQYKLAHQDVDLNDLMQNMAQMTQATPDDLMDMAMKGMTREKDIEAQAQAKFEAFKQDWETRQNEVALNGGERLKSSVEAEKSFYGEENNDNPNPFAPRGMSSDQRKAAILKDLQEKDDTITPAHLF